MKTKNRILVLILCVSIVQGAIAKKWQTVSVGYWNSHSIWLGGFVPSYNIADTFIIKHPIVLDSVLTLNTGAYLKIDSVGGICGHQKIIANTGTKIIKYGILELDTLSIKGGVVNCVAPGLLILTYNAFISNGASLSTTCSFQVGPWFDCHLPEYSFKITGVKETSTLSKISIFPNPCNGAFAIHVTAPTQSIPRIVVNDVLGNIVYQSQMINDQLNIDLSAQAKGIYYVKIISDREIIFKKIIVE